MTYIFVIILLRIYIFYDELRIKFYTYLLLEGFVMTMDFGRAELKIPFKAWFVLVVMYFLGTLLKLKKKKKVSQKEWLLLEKERKESLRRVYFGKEKKAKECL